MTAETRTQYWMRRGSVLGHMRKPQLVALYRKLGGLGGIHPPEKWYKEEIISSIVDMEWSRLPEDQKKPDPPRLTPPCDTCDGGQNAFAHRAGGDHNYNYVHDPDKAWVPESEAEAERIQRLEQKEQGSGQTRQSGDSRHGDDGADDRPWGPRSVPDAGRDGRGQGPVARP